MTLPVSATRPNPKLTSTDWSFRN